MVGQWPLKPLIGVRIPVPKQKYLCYNKIMKTNGTEKYFLFIVLLLTVILTFIILYPFLAMLIFAAAFAVVLSPIYLWINRYITKNIRWLASFLTVLLFLIGLCIPLFFIGKEIFIQSQDLYFKMLSFDNSSEILTKIEYSIDKILPSGFNIDLQSKITNMVASFSGKVAHFFSATINSILMFLLMVFTLFYLLKDGSKWETNIIKIIPLSSEKTKEILINLKKSINRIFKGTFIIAIVQGFLAWIGFTIFGVPNALIWALMAGVSSLVPTIGTSIISIPAILFLFFSGFGLQALGLLIWSMLIIGTVDNILNPYIISRDTEIPSIFVLFAILGSVSLLGPLGILIGPLILSLLYSLISIYKRELEN